MQFTKKNKAFLLINILKNRNEAMYHIQTFLPEISNNINCFDQINIDTVVSTVSYILCYKLQYRFYEVFIM